jgi:hypothetical protein
MDAYTFIQSGTQEEDDQAPAPAPQGPRNPYDDILDNMQRAQGGALSETLRSAEGVSPTGRAESLDLSNKFGVPVDVVERNIEDYRKQDAQSKNAYDEILERTPKLAEWIASHPDEAPVVSQSIGPAMKLNLLVDLGLAYERSYYDTQAMIARFVQQWGDTADKAPTMLRWMGPLQLARQGQFAMTGRLSAETWERKSADLGTRMQVSDVRDPESFAKYVLEGLGQNLTFMAVTSIGSLVGAPAAVALGGSLTLGGLGMSTIGGMIGAFIPSFVMGVGETRGNVAEKDPSARGGKGTWLAGAGIGALDALFPGSAVGERMTRLLGREAAEVVARRALMQPVKPKFLLRTASGAVKGFAVEGFTEALQEVIGQLSSTWTVGQKVDWGQVGQAALEAGVQGGLIGGVMEAGGSVSEHPTAVREYEHAQQVRQWFQALADGVKQMPAVTESPRVFEALMTQFTKGTPLENVYVETGAFREYWQAQDVSAEAVAQELTGRENALAEAEEAGTPLSIPTAAFAAKVAATDHAQFFINELKMHPEGVSLREAAEIRAQLKELFDDAVANAERARTSPEAAPETPIRQAVIDRLMADPAFKAAAEARGEDVIQAATDNAINLEAAFVALAGRRGGDPVALFNAYLAREAARRPASEPGTIQAPDGGAAVGTVVTASQEAMAATRTDFGSWFAGSQAVDDDGQPVVVYHGTPEGGFEAFKDSGGGIQFAADRNTAFSYSGSNAHAGPGIKGPGIYAAYLKLVNPLEVDFDGNEYDGLIAGGNQANEEDWTDLTLAGAIEQARAAGHDGLIARNIIARGPEGGSSDGANVTDVYVVFNPDQVALVAPDGTFYQAARGKSQPPVRLAVAPAVVENGKLRLSTRVPTSVKAQPETGGPLRTDLAAVRAAGPGFIKKLADRMGRYPQLTPSQAQEAPAAVVEHLVEAMVSNLRFLWDSFPAELRERAKLWYVGAQRIAEGLADQYGISDEQAAGVLAVLSPQMDWFRNVSLAERALQLYFQAEGENPTFTPELVEHYITRVRDGMPAYSRKVWREASKLAVEDQEALDAATTRRARAAAISAIAQRLKITPREVRARIELGDAKQAAYIAKKEKGLARDRENFTRQKWADLSLYGKARLLRALDETQNSPQYHVILPEGEKGDLARKAKGKPASIGWGTYQFIENAIAILQDGSAANIDALVGNEHKVRSFFNNISNPSDPDSVTIDTHAVAAALLQPLSGESAQVKLTMGGISEATQGLSGSNAVYAEAYFRLAQELGVLPREVQSVTWEAVRGLFTASTKKRGSSVPNVVKNLWSRYHKGELSLEEVHRGLVEAAAGINPPAWSNTPARVAGDEGVLPASDVLAGRAELPARRGDRGGDTAAAARRNTALADGPVVPDGGREFFQGELTPYEDLLNRVLEQGGFTYSVIEGEHRSEGLSLSPYPAQGVSVPTADLTLNHLVQFALANRELLAQPNHHFGAWNDTENGQVCLDVSIVVNDEAEAQRLGRENDQIAYFNLATFETVKIDYPEGYQHGPTWQGPGGPHAIEGRPGDTGAAREAVGAPDGSEPVGAGAGVGEGAPREFFQSAQPTVAEAFTSRLVAAVQASSLSKASGAQWQATIRNSKLGVNQDEFAFVHVSDLKADRVYSRQEVLDYLKTNALNVERVTLGDRPFTMAEGGERADQIYERRVAEEKERLEENGYAPAVPLISIELPGGPEAIGEEEFPYRLKVNGEIHDYYQTEEEARAAQAGLELDYDTYREDQLDRMARNNVDYGVATNDAWAELEQERGEYAETMFGTYQWRGHLAERDSYREMFLTAPQAGKRGVAALSEEDNARLASRMGGVVGVLARTRDVDQARRNIEFQVRLYQQAAEQAKAPSVKADYQEDVAVLERLLESGDFAWKDARWEDGHDDYADIQNPIVRLRLNVRELLDGQQVLFLEELQPPKEETGDFAKMPRLLQQNWRELGFKLALRYAVENNLAAVAWTPGDVQAERYSLRQAVKEIKWSVVPPYTEEEANTAVTQVSIHGKKRNIGVFLNREGVVVQTQDSYGSDVAIGTESWIGQPFSKVVGDKTAAVIQGSPSGTLDGEGLELGGEGLKRLYDVDFRNVVNKLPAVKKGGGRVEVINLPAGAESTIPVQAVTITPAMREGILGGQTLFQGERGRIRVGADRQVRIDLLEGADLSTFLHETGHLYLEVIGDIATELGLKDPATLTPGQAGIQKDYATLLSWLGVSSREDIGTAQHEQFARGFEAYLREGKAPSSGLREAFARFRGWLTSLYKTATQLNVQLTDEVREVFDRLLASDEAIEAARQEARLEPLFATAEAAGMTDAEFALYQKTAQAAHDKAQEALAAKLLLEYRQTRQRAYKARRKALAEEITATLERQPVYVARKALQAGILPDGTTGDVRLSKDAIVAKYGREVLATLPKPWVYTVDGGVDPDVAAQLFGFSSGDELLRTLASSPRLEDAVSEQVRQQLAAEFGDLANDGSLRELARQAVQENGYEKVLEAELRAIQKLAKTVGPHVRQAVAETKASEREKAAKVIDPLKAERASAREAMWAGLRALREKFPLDTARQVAAQRVAKMRLRDINPHTFWVAAQKAGQRALEAAVKNDYVTAAAEKQRQMLSVELFRAANRAIEEAKGLLKFARRFEETPTRARLGKAGHTYLDQVDAILDRFELANVSNRNLDRRASLVKWLEEREQEGLPVDGIPADVIEAARAVNYKELSLEALRDVRDTLRQIEHLARLKNGLLKGQKDKAFAQVRDELVAQLGLAKRSTLPLEYRPRDRWKEGIREWFANHAKIAMLARHLDGHVDGGPLWRALIRPLNEAADAETERRNVEGKKYLAIIQQHYPGRRIGDLQQLQHIPAIHASLSKEARLAVALNWGNETSRERLLHDPRRQWNQTQVKAILATLDRNDWEFVQATWDYVNTYWEEIAEKQRRVTGLAPEKVEAMPVETIYGTFRGGYYPLAYDSRMSARAGQVAAAGEAKLAMQAAYVRTTTRRGHVETRLQHVELPVRLELGVLFEHLDRVIHDLTHHEVLIDVGRLLRDKAIAKQFLDGPGEAVYRQFTTALAAIASNGRPGGERSVLDRAASWMKTGTQIAALGFNFWTAAQQPFGMFNGMQRVGVKWVLRGMVRWMKDAATMENTAAWINERSLLMRNRATTANQDLADLHRSLSQPGGWFDKMVRTVTADKVSHQGLVDAFLWHITLAQRAADIPTWLGGYEKAMAGGASEHDAVAMADQAVIDSQGGGEIKDLAGVQRGGPVARLFMTFYSYGSTVYNATLDAAGQVRARSPLSMVRFLGDLSLIYILPAVGTVMMAHLLGKGGDDDGPLEWLEDIGTESLSAALNGMIILRELGGLLRTGGAARGWSGPSGARFLQLVYNLANQVQQGVPDEGLWKALNAVGGVLFRYPSTQVQKTVDGWVALEEGRASNPAVLLAGPPPKGK